MQLLSWLKIIVYFPLPPAAPYPLPLLRSSILRLGRIGIVQAKKKKKIGRRKALYPGIPILNPTPPLFSPSSPAALALGHRYNVAIVCKVAERRLIMQGFVCLIKFHPAPNSEVPSPASTHSLFWVPSKNKLARQGKATLRVRASVEEGERRKESYLANQLLLAVQMHGPENVVSFQRLQQ